MSGHILNRFFTSETLHMRDLPASNAAYLPSSCDEELADEADEPPDFQQYISPKDILHPMSFSDGEFSKHSIRHTPPTTSLLTKALLTSPELGPVDRMPRQNPQRTMSTSSAWSIASTAELTSDGVTSPSRANTPSPPPPMYLTGLHAIIPSPKTKFALPPPLKEDPTVEGLERKRCITFAAAKPAEKPAVKPAPRLTFAVDRPQAPTVEQPCQPKKSALTFVCSKPTDKLSVPMKPTSQRTRSPAPKSFRKSEGVVDIIDLPKPQRWRHYDSPGHTDSWTDEPIDKSKLLRVDDLLKKEREIRKLSEEAAAEDADDMDDDDNNDENEDNDNEEEYDDEEDTVLDDNDDFSDEYLSDSDNSVYGGQSGNETDIEEGFASDDESDDELFFGPKLPPAFSDHIRPLGTRTISEDSDEYERNHLRKCASSPRRIRVPTPELPENEDFVCGTFDEDQPLEDAYISAIEERKRMKHKPTPQDIDPSFPTSDSEPEDEPQPRRRGSDAGRVSSIEKKSPGRVGRALSPAPMRRRSIAHSPAPVRRRMVSPPPPASRQGSRQASRQVSRQSSRQASRQGSPAPSTRGRLQFNTGFPTTRTRSLPRPGACFRRTGKTKLHAESRPMVIKRSAMDIYEGLEKRRERRHARLTRKPHGDGWRAGEGVEKMREVALDLCGRGKPQAQWVLSA